MEMNPQSNVAIVFSDATGTLDPEVAEIQLRANTYGLLAALLTMPPSVELRQRLVDIDVPVAQNAEGIAGAWQLLKLAAQRSNVASLDDEYHALFIGVGCGELVPYGSWYLTGFMMDKPLALLREELRLLGFERPPGVTEPEDHAATLCEVMAALIVSDDIGDETERHFFSEHLSPWMGAFFEDLQEAKSAVFYRAVGRLGKEFIALEQRYLAMNV
jgi:TorA maturation chaperone TorD